MFTGCAMFPKIVPILGNIVTLVTFVISWEFGRKIVSHFAIFYTDTKTPKYFAIKNGKISVTNFSHRKNKGDHLSHKRVFDPFLKLFSGFENWTFLKMSKIHFPFGFLEKSCY